MTNRIILNETSYFGAGAISVIPNEVTSRGFKKALIVTDKDLVKFGVTGKVTGILDKEQIPHVIFDDCKANPTIQNVKDGIAAFNNAQADFIIAIAEVPPSIQLKQLVSLLKIQNSQM